MADLKDDHETESNIQQQEIAVRLAALDVERAKLANARAEQRGTSYILRTIAPTVIAAILGLTGTAYVAYQQGKTNMELENRKFETSLILKAVETGDRADAQRNLLFLLDVGLIGDRDNRMRSRLARGVAEAPVLPAARGTLEDSPSMTGLVELSLQAENVTAVISLDGEKMPMYPGQRTTVPVAHGKHEFTWEISGEPGRTYKLTFTAGDGKVVLADLEGTIPDSMKVTGTRRVTVP